MILGWWSMITDVAMVVSLDNGLRFVVNFRYHLKHLTTDVNPNNTFNRDKFPFTAPDKIVY